MVLKVRRVLVLKVLKVLRGANGRWGCRSCDAEGVRALGCSAPCTSTMAL
jgi:hypothetical protein